MGDLWTIDSCGPHGIDLDTDEPAAWELEGPDDEDEDEPDEDGDPDLDAVSADERYAEAYAADYRGRW